MLNKELRQSRVSLLYLFAAKSPEKMNVKVTPSNMLSYEVRREPNSTKVYVNWIGNDYVGKIDGELTIHVEQSVDVIRIPINGIIAARG